MISRTVNSRRYGYLPGEFRSKKIKKESLETGSLKLSFIVALFVVMAAVIYMYSVNSSAVKGYRFKNIESQLKDLEKENKGLEIKEAELKSLRHIEEASQQLNLTDLKSISYIEEKSPVAMK